MAKKLKPRRLQIREGPKDKLFNFGHNLFLAGLGAAAKVAEEGPKIFAALVKKGETLRTRADPEKETAPSRARPVDTADLEKIEQIFTERTAQVLDGLDVATRSDIQTLITRIDALEQKTRTLLEQTPAQPGTPSSDTNQ